MKRSAVATWAGDGMSGVGTLSTQSGVFKKQAFSFKTRFGSEDGKAGTNPEELIAAAHAGCFSMALSFALSGAGHKPEELVTEAVVDIQQKGAGFDIVAITLTLKAKVPGLAKAKFDELAQQAKANCPVSKALSSVPIELKATLLG